MTRGNQRELARQKNIKKTLDKAKKKEGGMSTQARKQRDAEIMQQKQKESKKEEPKQEEPEKK
uniref:small EDRK-rich factor 2-like isoform X2 n=1 Tax=Myxine glutinosa TaxID=7769 RepID=UPI00358E4F96